MSKYRIGLDIGSNSVGWCVTDDNFNIVEKDNKKMWGVLMFEEQQKGQDRRLNRGNRRRTQRRRNRIIYLQEIFKPEIEKIDPTFFGRLDESFRKDEDRKNHDKYTLFIDKDFNDKDYFKKYPTIYHLQKELMESDKKADIRLIYLAISHCIKHRGNFLNPKNPESFNTSISKDEIKDKIIESLELLKDYVNDELYSEIDGCLSENFDHILEKNFSQTINDKTKLYNEIYDEKITSIKSYKNSIFEFVKLVLVGKEVKLINYFENNIDEENKTLSYKITNDQEEQIGKISTDFNDSDSLINALNNLNEVYQSLCLNNIFKGCIKTLPEAQVRIYDNYKKDLKELKKIIKENYGEEAFYDVFMNEKVENNYVHYTSTFNSYDTKTRSFARYKKQNTSKCSRDEFIRFLKTKFDLKKRNDQNALLFDLVTKDGFLVKPKSQNNAVYPYQLKYFAVKQIIEKQKQYYSFFAQKDDDGYSNEEKIISLLTFRIPYYFGPLAMNKNDGSELNSKWAWIKRYEGKESDHIRPWNYKDIVDEGKTQEVFINRMQNRCTYLKNEFCLPKDSIIFEKYLVYQFLNYIRINGNFYFNANRKDEIIKNLFLKNRKVTKKTLFEYINVNILNVDKNADSDIGFANGEIDDNVPSLSSLYDFVKVYGSIGEVDKNLDTIESIIKDIAILQDKTILEKRLINEYKLNVKQVKIVKGFNYKNFSSLSEKLLNGILPCDKNGEVIEKTILTLLKECDSADSQSLSLMRLLTLGSDSNNYLYDFKQSIDSENNEVNDYESRNDYIDDLYVPVSSKRAIKQTCSIIDEIKKILNLDNFDDISFAVEVTRKEGEKKRTNNRYKEMQDILNGAFNVKNKYGFNSDVAATQSLEHFKSLEGNDEGKVRSEKFYYYFMQLGRDIYTGEIIDYDNLDDYDIDHIIPQSLVKNDSINNKVLTKKIFNEEKKKNFYPIFNRITLFEKYGGNQKAKQFWKKLLDNKLISIEKYNSLIRTSNFSDDELEGFENRQKTTTDQSVKGFIEVLKNYYNVNQVRNIIYSKAANVTNFRAKYNIYKSRVINNYHHAHDAYLNIIVGTILDNTYKKNFLTYKNSGAVGSYQQYLEQRRYSVNPDKIIEMYVQSKQDGTSNEFISKIKENIYQTKNIFTKRRTYFGSNNVFGKISLLPPKENSIPIKNYLDCSKYGHYDSYNFSSYCLIKWKTKHMYTLEAIPSIYINDSAKWLKQIYGDKFNDFDIFYDKLKVNTKMKIGERCFTITGKTGDNYLLLNSIEKSFALSNVSSSEKVSKIIHDILKFIDFLKNRKFKDCDGNAISLLETYEYKDNNEEIIAKINDMLSGNFIVEKQMIKSKNYNKNNGRNDFCLKSEEVDCVYNLIIKLYSKKCYSEFDSINKVILKLEETKSFEQLNLVFKAKVIGELLNILKSNERMCLNLSFIDCSSKQSCTLYLCKNINIKKGERVKLIFESDTGFYRKVVVLK